MRYQKINGVIMAIGNKKVNNKKTNSLFDDFKRFIIITTVFVLGAYFIGYCQLIIVNEIEYFVKILFIGMIDVLWYAFYKLLRF